MAERFVMKINGILKPVLDEVNPSFLNEAMTLSGQEFRFRAIGTIDESGVYYWEIISNGNENGLFIPENWIEFK